MLKSTVFKKNYIFNVIYPQIKLKLIMKRKSLKKKFYRKGSFFFKGPTISTNEIVNILKLIDECEEIC